MTLKLIVFVVGDCAIVGRQFITPELALRLTPLGAATVAHVNVSGGVLGFTMVLVITSVCPAIKVWLATGAMTGSCVAMTLSKVATLFVLLLFAVTARLHNAVLLKPAMFAVPACVQLVPFAE